jgi:hypothetical protein
MDPTNPGSPRPTTRRAILGLGLVALVAVFVLASAATLLDGWLNPRTAEDGLTDDAVADIVRQNIEAQHVPGIQRLPDGRPDLRVFFGVLIVQLEPLYPKDAGLCRAVAATTVNPATGKSLGFSLVRIEDLGYDDSVSCKP